MNLGETGWLLAPELMVKSHYMGIRVLEVNIFARMGTCGVSPVPVVTLWEFFSNLLKYRWTGGWRGEIDLGYSRQVKRGQ